MPNVKDGLAIAEAALHRTRPEQGVSPTLAELTTTLDHISATQTQWRQAVAYLAAQVHAERNISGAEKGRAAIDTLHAIESRVAWFREHNP